MNRYLKFLKSNYKLAAIFAVGLIIQLQLGCSLIKSVAPNSNSGASNSSAASGGTTDSNAKNNSAATSDLCRNAYYPVGANVERKYSIKYQKMTNLNQEYAEKFSNFTADGFTSNSAFKDVTSNVNWRCLPEGLLTTQYGNSIEMKNGSTAKIDTISSNGVTYPAESEWNVGKKWTAVYNITESMKNPGGQTGNIEANGTVNQNSEIIGTEEITVPAGTFQAMKVRVTTTLDLTINVMGKGNPVKTSVQTTSWFAKDIGMVKTQADMLGLDSATAELLSYAGTK